MADFFKRHQTLKTVLKRTTLVLLFLALLFAQTTAFAWLATTWRSGTFSIRTKNVKAPTSEVWHYVYEADKSTAIGWYANTPTSITNGEELFSSIGSYVGNTFQPASKFSLYFGTINNLAQEQDNLPVYVKFTYYPNTNTTNKLILQYNANSDYVKLFQIDPSDPNRVGTEIENSAANHNLITTLNNPGEYPFVRLQYTASNTNYSVVPGSPTLSQEFLNLFDETKNGNLVEFLTNDVTTQSITVSNPSGTAPIYIYAKFTIRSDTLKNALEETDLKAVMPAYLLFRFEFGIDIQTQTYTH